MNHIEKLAEALPDACKDLRLNITSVLRGTSLTPAQTWAVALTSAYFVGSRPVAEALLADSAGTLTPADIDDARAAAAIMGMNTVYYRFRHLVGKPAYEGMRANLRMNRMMNPATTKAQFELCAMACAALAGCEKCIKAHDETLAGQQVGEGQIHDAVRIAACVAGFATALNAADFKPAA